MRPLQPVQRVPPNSSTLRKCLDIVGAAPHSGAGVSVYDCHGHQNQQWLTPFWTRYGFTQVYAWDGRCLDTHNKGLDDRTRVVVATCDGSRTQQWSMSLGADESVTLSVFGTPLCLEVYKSRNRNGNAVEVSYCTGLEDQTFRWQDWAQP